MTDCLDPAQTGGPLDQSQYAGKKEVEILDAAVTMGRFMGNK